MEPKIETDIKRKVLITIPWFLPAYRAGGPVRSIANLTTHFPDVVFFIFTSNTDINGQHTDGIIAGKWVEWNDHTKVWYAPHKKRSHELTYQVKKIRPDVIFMIGLYSWYFTIVPLLFCKAEKKIISVRGMLHPGALAQKSFKKKIFVSLMRRLARSGGFIFHATDREEEQYIRYNMGTNVEVGVAGNFPSRLGFLPLKKKEAGALTLISIALISPMKNILTVLKELKEAESEIEYFIYGGIKDPEYWEECRAVISELPPNVSVCYKGSVSPDKIKDALSASHVFILPSESENFGHALFEALSAGRPVITSYATPYRDLETMKAGINVHPENTGAIIKAVEYFAAMNDAFLSEWSEGALRFSENFFNTENVLGEYRRLFGLSA